jgi:predicted RNA-binding Zn-ribbon protein involved in translation (DUF1610 family)
VFLALLMIVSTVMEAAVRTLACPACGKSVNVRVVPEAPKHTFHCPHCKQIVTAAA